MYSRLLTPPQRKSFFLFGPRGTGKSFWVKAQFSKAVYIDLLEARIYNDLLADPQRLTQFIPRNCLEWIVIDEIQKVPALLDEVHRLIEKEKYTFVLTGSSARKLKRTSSNLLAGRALTYAMHPLTTHELGNDFTLEHSLRFGQLPSVYIEKDPQGYLESYVKTYLQEEVQQEGLVRNLSAFSRFLEAASFSQASIINFSNIARECAVERKVVENYFSILEDLLLGVRVPPFLRKAKRRLLHHHKFYFFDVGVYRTLRPQGPLDLPEEIEGGALETLVMQELRAFNDNLKLKYQLYYWATADRKEVDFVLYGERGFLAFEVKRTGRIKEDDLKGLRTFLKDYPAAKAYFIYLGDRRFHEGVIEIIPIHLFFKELIEILKI